MSLASLSNIAKFFSGREPSEGERQQLFKEALLMTLARASNSDANVSPVEVDSVQEIVRRETGEEVSLADVRVAAKSELYERATLDHYLAGVSRKLTSEERSRVLRCLAEVIHSDVRVSSREVAFFDWVAHALKATPSEIVGLVEQD